MIISKSNQKNVPDNWLQPVNVLLCFLIASGFLVLFSIWVPHAENLSPYAVASMGSLVTSLYLTVEWAIRSPSSKIFPPRVEPFHKPLSKIILAALIAAVVLLATITFLSTARTKISWKPAAEVLTTRISFSNSPFLPLAPPSRTA